MKKKNNRQKGYNKVLKKFYTLGRLQRFTWTLFPIAVWYKTVKWTVEAFIADKSWQKNGGN